MSSCPLDYWKPPLQIMTFGEYTHGTQVSSQPLVVLKAPSWYFFLRAPCYQSSNLVLFRFFIIHPDCEQLLKSMSFFTYSNFSSGLRRKANIWVEFLPTQKIYLSYCPAGPLLYWDLSLHLFSHSWKQYSM